MGNIKEIKSEYYHRLDNIAEDLAKRVSANMTITTELISLISDLYKSANCEKEFCEENFECAYHNPITSELEFLIARILYHFSNINKLGWTIHLRRQSRGKDGKLHVPDVLIRKKEKVIAVIEIKAKAGWIQPFFSSERVKKDLERLERGDSNFNPKDMIAQLRKSLESYAYNYDIDYKKVFLLLPTLALVHRKKHKRELEDYKKDFAENSGLPKENLIIFSKNLRLDLALNKFKLEDYEPTDEFENFLKKLKLD